jgi:hypothetical protein
VTESKWHVTGKNVRVTKLIKEPDRHKTGKKRSVKGKIGPVTSLFQIEAGFSCSVTDFYGYVTRL